MSGWERVAELGAAQVAAVTAGRFDELVALQREQRALLATVGRVPVDAEPLLAAALACADEAERILRGAIVERKGLLERIRLGRRTLGAYGAPRPASLERHA